MGIIFGNITLTTAEPIAFSHHSHEGLPMMTRGIDSNGQHLKTVFWPAAALRGRIRHEVAFETLEKEGKAKLGRAYMLALGQSIEGNVEEEADVTYKIAEQKELREKDPVVDLFGTWKIPSRLQVSHLMPAVNVYPDRLDFIRRDLDSNEQLFELLPEEDQNQFYERQNLMSQASKVNDMIKAATSALMKAKKENNIADIDAIEAKITELKSMKKQSKDDAGGDGNNTKHLLQLECIPAGVDLLGHLRVMHAKPRDLSMLVGAFDRISQKPLFGAATARGCGEVRGNITFTNDNGEVLCTIAFGGYRKAEINWTEAGKQFLGTQ